MTVGDQYDVVFLALARDCASTLPGALRGFEALRDSGLRVRLVVGENGSRDETRTILEDAAASTGIVEVLDTSFMAAGGGSRLERMATGRQFLADQIKDFPWPVRAICVVDLDEPFLESLDPALFTPLLSRLESEKAFALSASSRPTYYDLLAFEDDTRSFVGLDERIKRVQRNPILYYRLFKDFIYVEQHALTSGVDIWCISAFNGLCLYPAEIYALGSYIPVDGADWICEHITFNRSIAEATGLHMVIDGSLVIPTPPEHGPRTLSGFIWQRARKLPRMLAARLIR